jgi:hypothetical protein
MLDKVPNEVFVSEKVVPDSTVIWRYFKLNPFMEFVKTHSLWFSRPFRFEDAWEGRVPPSYVRRIRQHTDAKGIPFGAFDWDFRGRQLRHQYAHFVNCWHMSVPESDAMWKLYGLIAIQSTVGDVNECLAPHFSGQVIYYDPAQDVRNRTIFGPHDILFKRNSFSWEQEYRFWFYDDELLEKIDAGMDFREEDLSPGHAFPVSDLRRFIKKIVVAPGASGEFIEELRTVFAKHRKNWLWSVTERSYSDRMWDSFTR